jgi:arylsulfatase A-like enzyme
VRVAEPVHLVDVLPTLLAAAGAGAPPAGTAGIDLLAALAGERALSADRPIYLTRPYFGERARRRRLRQEGWGFGIRRGDWKLIVAPSEERRDLFDLGDDPREKSDVADADPERAGELGAMLDAWRASETAARGGALPEMPRDVRRKLRALGYVQ